jgi:SAM-dependent methyltransferase
LEIVKSFTASAASADAQVAAPADAAPADAVASAAAPPPPAPVADSKPSTAVSVVSHGSKFDAVLTSLDLANPTFLGITAKEFPFPEQQVAYRLLRKLHHDKLYPLDVNLRPGASREGHPAPQHSHTYPSWGAKRGYPIGRWYMNKWMQNFREYAKTTAGVPGNADYDASAQQFQRTTKCLEIGDGHFIKPNIPDYFGDGTPSMNALPMCSTTTSMSADLVDKKATVRLNLEDPFGSLRERQHEASLREGFDLAVCSQVFEHVDKPYEAMVGLASLIKPGGYLLFSVPFLGNPVHGHLVHSWTSVSVELYAKHAGLQVVTNLKLGNALTAVGYNMELSADDFTEEEMMKKDADVYIGAYALLRKPHKPNGT